jgi:hypothetical protein
VLQCNTPFIPGPTVLTPGSSLGSYIVPTDQHNSFGRTLSSLIRTRENFTVGHLSQITPSQAHLTWRFFQDRLLKKKMHLVFLLPEEFLDQTLDFLPSDSNKALFYTSCHRELQIVPSLDLPDNYYYKKTMHRANSYPNFYHILKHKLLTCPLIYDLFFLFSHLSADGKLS